jgi:hypothetical protein
VALRHVPPFKHGDDAQGLIILAHVGPEYGGKQLQVYVFPVLVCEHRPLFKHGLGEQGFVNSGRPHVAPVQPAAHEQV